MDIQDFLKDYNFVTTVDELNVEITNISRALTEVEENIGQEDAKIQMFILKNCIKKIEKRLRELE